MKTKEIDARQINSMLLPKPLRKGKIFVLEGKDSIVFKKIIIPSLAEVRQKLKTIKGKISESVIDREIQNFRKGK